MHCSTFILVAVTLLGATLVRGFDEKEALAQIMKSAEACMAEVDAGDADVQELVKRQPASTCS